MQDARQDYVVYLWIREKVEHVVVNNAHVIIEKQPTKTKVLYIMDKLDYVLYNAIYYWTYN